jgi:hypothetical protein
MKEIKVCTGEFTQIDDDIYRKYGQLHWHFDGYSVHCRINNELVILHRLVLGLKKHDKVIGDHKDRNPLNNQRSNLRKATVQQNRFNVAKTNPEFCTSIYKGVYKRRGRFIAQIQHNGKKFYLGSFKSETNAALAYNKQAQERFGEFAYLNQIKGEIHA